MVRKKKLVVIVLALMCFSVTAFCCEKVEAKPDPFKDTSVLVEAFMVRVSTAALIESGVNPISNGPEGVSILNILWCLQDSNFAKVVSGAKVTAGHREKSSMTSTGTFYIKTTSGPQGRTSTRYNAYNFANQIGIIPAIISVDKIRISADYSSTEIEEDQQCQGEDKQADQAAGPPRQKKFDWSGTITAKPGVPLIAAAVQSDEENISFLIVTATIQGGEECTKN